MLINIEDDKDIFTIRHQLDPVSGTLYLSIVDVIEKLGLSSDSRNYWKTLKSRLKNTQNKLVTKCNQLKMRASDGKMYLTDATDSDNMLVLVQHIAPTKVGEFRRIFKKIEKESSPSTGDSGVQNFELSTEGNDEYEILVDAYEDKDNIIIEAMLAGVNPDDISIIASCQNILIKAKRNLANQRKEEDYLTQELVWGKFSRGILLPAEVDIEEIETKFNYGVLEIKIPKIDKTKTKIIKVK